MAENLNRQNLNRQRVLNFLETLYSGDLEGALARCSDDIVFAANAPVDILPHMGSHHGKAEIRKMWETIHSRYSGTRYEVRTIVADGDRVAALLRVFFRKRATSEWCSSILRTSTRCAMAGSPRSASSWIPSIWCSRCWNATSPRR